MGLSFQNITHEIGGNVLFKDVSFSLDDGGLLVIKGPNGCGKTTLLKILSGLLIPKYGFIFDGENEISEDYRTYFANIQFIGHKNALDLDCTVLENLQFWAGLLNSLEIVDATVTFFRLEKYLHTQCKHLSAGWQRRVALSRLMLTKSRIWFLDEPLSNLDEEMIEITLRMIAVFCDQGGTIVMSSHQELRLPFGQELQLTDFV